MSNSEKQVTGGRLHRDIGLIGLIAGIIGINIGGSLFVLTGIAAGLTGPSLAVAQIISALPIFLALIPYAVLTSSIPATCGSYHYAKLFSFPGAVAGWMVLFVAIPIGALPLFAISAAKMLSVLFPALPVTATAIIIMTLFYIINLAGIKPTAYVQLAGTALLLLALLTFIIPGIPAIRIENLSPLFTGGIGGLIAASAILFTLLAGGLFGIDLGGEVKTAKSAIPRALVISMIIVLVIYLLIEVVAVGVLDWKIFANDTLGGPAKMFLSGMALDFFVIGGGVLACITTINLILTVAGRYVLVFTQDGFFPRCFSGISRRFGTPHWGLTLAYVMSVITLLVNPPLQTMGAMLNFGLIFMITLVLLAGVRLPKTHPEIYNNARYKFNSGILSITSISAAVINLIFMVILAIAMKWAFLFFVVAVAAGIILYFARVRKLDLKSTDFITRDLKN